MYKGRLLGKVIDFWQLFLVQNQTFPIFSSRRDKSRRDILSILRTFPSGDFFIDTYIFQFLTIYYAYNLG